MVVSFFSGDREIAGQMAGLVDHARNGSSSALNPL
jgi:hypothetical protein